MKSHRWKNISSFKWNKKMGYDHLQETACSPEKENAKAVENQVN